MAKGCGCYPMDDYLVQMNDSALNRFRDCAGPVTHAKFPEDLGIRCCIATLSLR